MNALSELQRLMSHFPDADQLFGHVDHIPATTTPAPYHDMLVHHEHMTVAMERYHGGPVSVEVRFDDLQGDLYCREIVLYRTRPGERPVPVQFGLVRFDLQYVSERVREQILARQTPLGRVLIEHDVLRQVDLGAILKVTAGHGLGQALQIPVGTQTYGRLATIFCNQQPAIDLLEVTAPLIERWLPTPPRS